MAQIKELSDIQGGVILDLFEKEMAKVLDNIADDNVVSNAAREINIKISIKPDKTRRGASVKVDVISKLAPAKPAESVVFLENDGLGTISMYQDDVKQPELDGNSGVFSMPKTAQA